LLSINIDCYLLSSIIDFIEFLMHLYSDKWAKTCARLPLLQQLYSELNNVGLVGQYLFDLFNYLFMSVRLLTP